MNVADGIQRYWSLRAAREFSVMFAKDRTCVRSLENGVAKSSDPMVRAGAHAVGPPSRPTTRRQRRRRPGLVAEAPALPAATRRRPPPAGEVGRPLRRAPLPLQRKLPRRWLPSRGAGRGGDPPRPRSPRPHRPRRHVRRRPLRRGGEGAGHAHRLRRRADPGQAARSRAAPTTATDRHPRPARRPPGRPGPRPGRVRPAVPGDLRGADGRLQGCSARRPRPRRALGPRRPARLGPQRRPGPAGRPGPGRGGGDQQRPLRHPGPPPAGDRAGRGARSLLPCRAGRLAARRRRRPPAGRVRAGGPPGPLPGHRRAGGRGRPGPRLRPEAGRPPPARLPGPARPHRDELATRAGRAGRDPPLRAAGRRAGARRLAADRPRADNHRAARLPRLLPGRLGHRAALRARRHLLPGQGLRSQLGGLLRARHHQGRRRLARPAVRALPVAGARRPPRHRPRHRGRPAGGGHPVRLRPLRQGPGRPGRQRDHLPAALGRARHGAGPRLRARPARHLVHAHHGVEVDLADLPQEPAVYELLCRADSIGVFQVESRAQMATLPRLRPRTFYDLVVEVALIRPGPIQGGSVHPYIRRRNGQEPVTYLHPLLERSLAKTLGVPLFQEQLMQMAVDVAGFTAAEADQLRQAMGAKRSSERMERLKGRLYLGMAERGITGEVADRIYEKLAAFANFGFPESHSVSFAYLVYSSAWLKLHYPAAFLAALLNAQPMGFWSPHTLVADARRHGVVVRGPDVNLSTATATLEAVGGGSGPSPPENWADTWAVRLGIAYVRNLGEDLAERVAAGRPYASMTDLVRRTGAGEAQVEALATAGAFGSLGLERRAALWAAGAVAQARADRLPGVAVGAEAPRLPGMSPVELGAADLWATGLSADSHPVQFVREQLDVLGAVPADGLAAVAPGTRVLVGGVVTHRQRPATAGGTTFLNLEDETGLINVICSKGVWARYRRVGRTAAALLVRGRVERAEGVVNVIADQLRPLPLAVATRSR